MTADSANHEPYVPGLDLIRPIGRGGFGEVWLAVNVATGQPRAVKLIPRRGAGASRELLSLTRLEALARQRGRDLLPIHHVGNTEEYLFFVMDLADDIQGGPPTAGETYRPATLESMLGEGPLAPGTCLEYSRQLLRALGSLHEAGMVHRDVKPGNCLFVGGELKLADFGLLTEAGPEVSRVGTETYMPPDGRMDTQADVYAAGLVIYEMLTGLPASRFPGLGVRANEIVRDRTLSVLLRLILTACSLRREERYQSAGEMAAALEEMETHGPPTRREVSRWLAGACITVALVVGGILLFLPGEDSPRVDVSFITEPYHDAVILLDGRPVAGPDGLPWKTPCTIEALPARAHQVAFRLEGQPLLDAGAFDFSEVRQIKVWWPE